jgi:hypothetical protein
MAGADAQSERVHVEVSRTAMAVALAYLLE